MSTAIECKLGVGGVRVVVGIVVRLGVGVVNTFIQYIPFTKQKWCNLIELYACARIFGKIAYWKDRTFD